MNEPAQANSVAASDAAPPEARITDIAAKGCRIDAASWLALWVMLLAAFGSALLPGPALSEHECLVAQTAREMLETGDWAVPHFSGMPRLQKPPLAYWCVAALAKLTGRLDEFTCRLPSVLSGLALTAFMAYLGWRVFGSAALAWFTAAVTGFCAAVLFYSHSGTVDMQLTFWCALSIGLFWFAVHAATRARRILLLTAFGIAMGLAMLAKGPMPLPVVLPGIALYLLATGRIRSIPGLTLEALPGIAAFFALWLPWPITVAGRVGADAALAKWYREFFLRYEGLVGSGGPPKPLWYYVPVLLAFSFPWTGSLFEALAGPFAERYRKWKDPLLLALCVVAFNFVFFSSAGYKRPHYLLPVAPWLALLLVPAVWRFFAGPLPAGPGFYRSSGTAVLLVSLLGAGAAIGWLNYKHVEFARQASALAVILGVGFAAAGLCIAFRGRLASLWCMLATITVGLTFGWVKIGPYVYGTEAEKTFAAKLTSVVPAGTQPYSLGPPNARLVFYGNVKLRRVITDLELERQIRKLGLPRTPRSAMLVGARRLIDLISTDQPVFVVAQYGHWQKLQQVKEFTQLQPALLYVHRGYESDPEDDLIIFANRRGAAMAKLPPSAATRGTPKTATASHPKQEQDR